MQNSKRKIFFLLRILFTIILAAFAFYKAGFLNEAGREKFINFLSNARVEFLIPAILISFVLNSSSAIKWYMLLKSRGIVIRLWRVYGLYAVGQFFNLILPTSMGGDVVRIFQLGKYTGEKHSAAASVIVERFTGLVTLVLIALGAVVVNVKLFNQLWLSLGLILGVFVLGIIIWLVLDDRIFYYFHNRLKLKSSFVNKILLKLSKVREAVLEYKSDKKALFWAVVNSLIFQLLAVLNVWLCSLVFSSELSLLTCFAAVPVILFIMNIPISIGGIGLMEFAYVFVFSIFGVSPSLAISTALLLRLKSILNALIGGVFYVSMNREGSALNKPAIQSK